MSGSTMTWSFALRVSSARGVRNSFFSMCEREARGVVIGSSKRSDIDVARENGGGGRVGALSGAERAPLPPPG